MWVLLVFGAMLSVMAVNSFYTEYMQKEVPWNANETTKNSANFKAFAAAANVYIRVHSGDTAYLPSGTQVVYWSDYTDRSGNTVKGLKRAVGLPAVLASADVDASWRIYIYDTTTFDYVLCTAMPVSSISALNSLPDHPLWNSTASWVKSGWTSVGGKSLVGFDVAKTTETKNVANEGGCTCDPMVSSGVNKCS